MVNPPKTRVCSICLKRKPLKRFGIHQQTLVSGKVSVYARRDCSNCKSKKWAAKNPAQRRRINRDAKKRYRARQMVMKLELLEFIGQRSCVKCGESDIRCLTFHHRHPSKKKFTISWGFTHSYSVQALKREAAKCDVLCANCHIKHHGTNLEAN